MPPLLTPGGEAAADVRRELEAKRDALVANYVTKRDALVAEILPEVRARAVTQAFAKRDTLT